MRLDLGSLMFNMNLDEGGNPSWGTDLGQGQGYKFNFENYETFLTALLYQKIEDINNVWCPLGKGGARQDDFEYVIASLFTKVYVNNNLVPNAKFVLLIVKQKYSGSNNHIGRRSLKYSPRIKYNGIEYNNDCYKKIISFLGLNSESAWFVNDLNTKNQDELHFNVIIADKDHSLHFHNTQERKEFVRKLLNENISEEYNKFKHLLAFFVNQLRINNDLVKGEPHSGKGYRGDKIREFYEKYREYDGFTLDCTIQSGYNRTSSGANYVHNGGTNIRPNFNLNKDVEYLYLDLYKKENPSDAILELLDKKYSINDLDLFSEGEPTSTLIALFDDYKLLLSLVNDKDHAESKIEKDSSKYLKTGENVILYGVPGSGKSYKVKHEYLAGLGEEQHERVVFHPDYTYSDFVGQILPEKGDNGSLTYKFNPGPFTRIMKKAYESPDKKFVLVIEEINRGNAPAIFGDIFQLLDREKEGDEEGFSEYSITNHEIGRELFDDEDAKIKIPSNLSIVATMNTSDQNVFTLDNAFQRRWKMVQVANVFDKSKKEEKDLAETKVLDTDLIWEDFMKIINEQILNKNITMTSMEDKRLGTHFVDKNLLKDDRQFSGKVLKYLWDDGFKFARNDVFNSEFKTLEDLTEKFVSNSGKNRLDIFNESVKKAIDEYLEDIKNRGNEDDGKNS